MAVRFPIIFLCLLTFAATTAWLSGQSATLEGVGKRAERVGSKRVDMQMWSSEKSSDLLSKTFPFQQWDKHYSSLGSKRAGLKQQWKGSKKFDLKTIEFDTKDFDFSRWNQMLVELKEKARVSTDIDAERFVNTQMYQAMLQDTQQFKELREELSLRDLNRFQFRRNRSDGELPVQAAGEGQ